MNIRNKNILLATMHRKEIAIKEPFSRYLTAAINVPDQFDTDQFGTFSGEIPRKGSPKDAALNKAQTAGRIYSSPYVLASEGTFLPHPAMPFINANHELLLLLNNETGEYELEELLSTNTNFSALSSDHINQLDAFLKSALFNSHAINIIPEGEHQIIKGITDHTKLESSIKWFMDLGVKFKLETDMRAHLNPTRMNNIHLLACNFAKRLATPCPGCHNPGFGLKKTAGVLPCEVCMGETALYAHKIEYCRHCDFEVQSERPDQKQFSDPTHCYQCNP